MIRIIPGICFILAVAATANADQLITNGGFETGDFTGWTVTTNDTPGTGDWYVTNAFATPLGGWPTAGPAEGIDYAVTDFFENGTRALTQSFVDPTDASAVLLSFDFFINDQFGASGTGGQVDLFAANADPLTATPLAVLYGPSDTEVNHDIGYNPWIVITDLDITADLTPGSAYQLSFIESDDNGPINMGVDGVALVATPEPNTLFLVISAGAFVVSRRYRVKSQRPNAF